MGEVSEGVLFKQHKHIAKQKRHSASFEVLVSNLLLRTLDIRSGGQLAKINIYEWVTSSVQHKVEFMFSRMLVARRSKNKNKRKKQQQHV